MKITAFRKNLPETAEALSRIDLSRLDQSFGSATVQDNSKLKNLARINFDRWNQSLKTTPEQVARTFAPDASLLPTQLWGLQIGRPEVIQYFGPFLELKPVGKIVNDQVRAFGQKNYLHWGENHFTLDSEENRQTLITTCTFNWQMDESGEWKIAHLHSSAFEPATANDNYLRHLKNRNTRDIINNHTQAFNADHFLFSGLFAYVDKSVKEKPLVMARYTLIKKLFDLDKWETVYYHLSKKPETEH